MNDWKTTVPEPYSYSVGEDDRVIYTFREFDTGKHSLDTNVALVARHSSDVFRSLRHPREITAREFREWYLEKADARLFIVEEDGIGYGFAGLCYIDMRDHTAEISWALPGFEKCRDREGMLVRQVLDWGVRCGIQHVRSEVYTHCLHRVEVLQEAGMKITGFRDRTKWDDDESEWVGSLFLEFFPPRRRPKRIEHNLNLAGKLDTRDVDGE